VDDRSDFGTPHTHYQRAQGIFLRVIATAVFLHLKLLMQRNGSQFHRIVCGVVQIFASERKCVGRGDKGKFVIEEPNILVNALPRL
jgi:hypothetical protein